MARVERNKKLLSKLVEFRIRSIWERYSSLNIYIWHWHTLYTRKANNTVSVVERPNAMETMVYDIEDHRRWKEKRIWKYQSEPKLISCNIEQDIPLEMVAAVPSKLCIVFSIHTAAIMGTLAFRNSIRISQFSNWWTESARARIYALLSKYVHER